MSDEKESGSAEWMQKLWRPAMGWMYMIICLADMLVFPVLWSLLQAMMHMPITQWNPLTLQGAGLFHIAMGAVLGISAFGRTQEKLAGTAANPSNTSTTPSFGGSPSGFNSSPSGSSTFSVPAPATSSFGGGGFGSVPATTPTSGFGGGFGATSTSQPVSTNASGKKVVPQDDFPPL
jgi:hypothetical protein